MTLAEEFEEELDVELVPFVSHVLLVSVLAIFETWAVKVRSVKASTVKVAS